MKFEIKNRWTGNVQFTAEIDASDDTPTSVKIGLAVRWAVKSDANLSDANLSDANLSGANLRGANLSDANLSDANLSGANLRGAYLRGANLSDANLSGANLRGANLSGANLSDANLSDAYLRGANLSDANLSGAKWADDILISKAPIEISGLNWPVYILDTHMQIGCEVHSHEQWEKFSNKEILAMDGRCAARFWKEHKKTLLALCKFHVPKQAAQKEAA